MRRQGGRHDSDQKHLGRSRHPTPRRKSQTKPSRYFHLGRGVRAGNSVSRPWRSSRGPCERPENLEGPKEERALLKQGSEDHAKFKLLARLLRIPLPYANGIMERLWNKAAQFRPDGAVGRWSNLEIAEYCAMPLESNPDELVEAMVTARLLDVTKGPNRLLIHDWSEHCTHFTHNKIARHNTYFATGEAPNLRRLDPRYRPAAESFYGVSAQSGEKSAQSGEKSAQSGEKSAQSQNPPKQTDIGGSAQSGKKSAQSPLQRARPTPTPTPTPTPKSSVRSGSEVLGAEVNSSKRTAAASNGHHINGTKWPHAAGWLRNQFPTSESESFATEFANLCISTITAAGGDIAKFTDDSFVEALKTARFKGQRSAAGFRKTLPVVVKNWSKSNE